METLDHKVIVYDDACPMCQAYTAGFVKAGWLKERKGFGSVSPELLAKIDFDRARHEIPLLDTKTGEVTYGLSALFLIIGERMPIFKPLFRSSWFRPLLYPLYQIITYNRRIIAGSGAPKTGCDCAPDVNLFYRWLYISLAVIGASLLSYPFVANAGDAGKVFILLHLFILLGLIFVPKRLDFVGHWATVFLATSMVLRLLPGGAWIQAGLAGGLVVWMWWKRLDKVWSFSSEFPGIEKTPGVCGGVACIIRTRIPVRTLVSFKNMGLSDQNLLANYPSLLQQDLNNAWAYYQAFTDEIDLEIRENEEA